MPDINIDGKVYSVRAIKPSRPASTSVKIDIDGKVYAVKAGDNLLQACLSLGLDLPYFCWHPALGSVGACRQCAVIQFARPDDTQGRLVMACMTPVTDGMRVSLQNPDARAFRAGIIEMLMTNHPHDCPVCEEGGECHLQDMTEMTGHTFRAYRGTKRTHRNQYLGPFINHEMNRCIACYRCVRYYQDYCGGDDLQVFAAHDHVYFGRFEDGVLENEFSGNLVEVCPTGVFTDKTFSRRYTRKWDLQSAPSVCVHCGIGCNTCPGERYGSLRRVVNRYHGEINGYFLCDRGRFGYDFVNSEKRLRQSTVRNEPPMSTVGSANYFAKLLKQAQGVIGIGSPRASLESNFALRELVGRENFHLGIAADEQAQLELIVDLLQNGPVRIASLREVEQSDAVLVLGEDVTQTAPRLALSLRQAVRNRTYAIADSLRIPRWQDAAVRTAAGSARSPLFVASCAATRLDDVAEKCYRGSPAALAALGFAIAHHVTPKAPAPESVEPELDEVAHHIAAALGSARRPLIVSGTGTRSIELLRAAAQVALALAAARNGTPVDVHFAIPECNSLGLALLGGGSLAQAMTKVAQNKADTVVVLENDLFRRTERSAVEGFLDRAKQVIVLDHIVHETVARAHLTLACTNFAESEGTYVNSEARAQRYFSVYPPGAEVRDSWRWLGCVAGKTWSHVDDVVADCAQASPVFASLPRLAPDAGFRIQGQKIPRQPNRYSGRTAMLAHVHIHEPKPMEDADSPLAFSMEGTLENCPPVLRPFVWAPGWNSNQAVSKFQDEVGGHWRGGDPGGRLIEPKDGQRHSWFPVEGPKPLAAGSLFLVPLYHIFGSDELSMLAPALAERAPKPYLAVHPEDAARLSLHAGQVVNVGSAGAEAALTVVLRDDLARGVAGIPLGLPGVPWLDVSKGFRPVAGKKSDSTGGGA